MSAKAQTKNQADVGRTYWFVVWALVVLVVFLAAKLSLQTQARHSTYYQLSAAKRDYHALKIEERRLLIEQQTYSATPSVAQRAVSELEMYYPSDKDRLVIAPPAPSHANSSNSAQSSAK